MPGRVLVLPQLQSNSVNNPIESVAKAESGPPFRKEKPRLNFDGLRV